MSTAAPQTPPPQEELNSSNTAPFPDTPTQPADVPSIGERLAENEAAKPAPAAGEVALEDAQTGDAVQHDTHGRGVVINRNDITLWVKFDSQPRDAEPIMFGIAFSKKTMRVIGKGAAPTAGMSYTPNPIPEAAKPLTEEEITQKLNDARCAHIERAGVLSARYLDLDTEIEKVKAELKGLKDEQDQIVTLMVENAKNPPSRETVTQRTIDLQVNGPTGAVSSTVAKEVRWDYGVAKDQVVPLVDTKLTLDELHQKMVTTIEPGKKVKNLESFGVIHGGQAYLPREVSPDKTRWFLQAIVDLDAWDNTLAEKYGPPVSNFDASKEAGNERKAGGDDCGRLIKVGKAKVVLAPESMGLVIVASKEAAEKFIGWQNASAPVGEKAKE